MSGTATATPTNDRPPRKQLSDQLDRLDGILDALAEGLPGAITDACRDGARVAVREALAEIVASPELHALLQSLASARAPASAPPPPAPPARPGLWGRLKASLAAARDAVVGRCQAAAGAVASAVRTLAGVVPLKKVALTAAAAGVAVGLVSYACPHAVAAVISGVGGACTAAAAHVGAWLRRSFRVFGLGTA
jgi:multidrug resistance efflux pump